jgi:hypothetical protein
MKRGARVVRETDANAVRAQLRSRRFILFSQRRGADRIARVRPGLETHADVGASLGGGAERVE